MIRPGLSGNPAPFTYPHLHVRMAKSLMSSLQNARRVVEHAARWLRRTVARRALPRSGPFWVSLELPSPLHDVPGRMPGERAHTLLGLLQTLEAIAEEPRAH